MSIRPKWIRDICSLLFATYYILFPSAADEKACRLIITFTAQNGWRHSLKLRRFRAVPTVEVLRATWNKTTHPFVWFICFILRGQLIPLRFVWSNKYQSCRSAAKSSFLVQKVLPTTDLSLPTYSSLHLNHNSAKQLNSFLIFLGVDLLLCHLNIMKRDCGFGPPTQESQSSPSTMARLQNVRTNLSTQLNNVNWKLVVDPYPFAIDEIFDVYRLLVESGRSEDLESLLGEWCWRTLDSWSYHWYVRHKAFCHCYWRFSVCNQEYYKQMRLMQHINLEVEPSPSTS